MKIATLPLAVLLVMFLVVAAPLAAPAADWFSSASPAGTACTQAEPCDLNHAVSLAAAGDTIYLATGTYTAPALATHVLWVGKSLRFLGGWDGTTTSPPVRTTNSTLTILDGEAAVPVLRIQGPGVAVTLDTLSVYRGLASDRGGGISAAQADLTLRTVFVYQNRVVATAANNMDFGGGGVHITGGTLKVFSSILTGNWAINTNGYYTYGGAILLNNVARAVVKGSIINNNDARYGSGIGMRTQEGATTPMKIRFSWFVGNGRGNSGSTVTVEYGGGLSLERAAASVFGCLFQDNGVTQGGSAVYSHSGRLNMDRSTILGNTAGQDSTIVIFYGTARLQNNIIADNDSGTAPSAAAVSLVRPDVTATLIHNTIIGRSGAPRGTGVWTENDAQAALRNNIIARFDTGAYVKSGGKITLKGTLWGTGGWANGADTAGNGILGSIITLGEGNISGDPAFLDPAISGVYHIGAQSAARNAGLATVLAVDHDGKPRDAQPDIGADEYITKVLLLTPNGGQILREGSAYPITWGGPGKAQKFKLYFSRNGGATWKLIDGDVSGRFYIWTVPEVTGTQSDFLVRVNGFNASWKALGLDVSDAPFTILDTD